VQARCCSPTHWCLFASSDVPLAFFFSYAPCRSRAFLLQLSSSSLGSTWRDRTLRLKSSWLLSHSMAASPLRGDALGKEIQLVSIHHDRISSSFFRSS
jgi:hypothetical protein